MTAVSSHTNQYLQKLSIEKLNPMQEAAYDAIREKSEVVLLSPTGSGKTLAFLLPILELLDREQDQVQALVLVPARELAQQIEQVLRAMGTGFKVNAVYGGRAGSEDKIDLRRNPAVLIGTPGRIADHLRKETFALDGIKTLVLDEFDKSLEIGFEADMSEILAALPALNRKVLTSATQAVEIPEFVGLKSPKVLDFQTDGPEKLAVRTILSPDRDKLETLYNALCHLRNTPGIVFINFRDAIERVSSYLTEMGVEHGCFHGGMEQRDRERALVMFRNGTYQTLLATDLAARGIDVPELQFIIHYHLPTRAQEFTHRNGRTARMNRAGSAYVLLGKGEERPDFIPDAELEYLEPALPPKPTGWTTLYVTGGRRDKISKGDIAGLFFKQGQLERHELGMIELKPDSTYVAVASHHANRLVSELNNTRLKKKKVRVSRAN